MTTTPLMADVLVGARAIAQYLYGSEDERSVAAVYRLRAKARLPFMRWSGQIALRKSTLEQWMRKMETASAAGLDQTKTENGRD